MTLSFVFTLASVPAFAADFFDVYSPDATSDYLIENEIESEVLPGVREPRFYSAAPAEVEVKVYSKNHARPEGLVKKEHLEVYRGGQLVYNWLTSTACDCVKHPTVGAPYRPNTPRGTWTIQRAVRDEVSRVFGNAPMNFALYFGPKVPSGIAIHATYGANVGILGTPASGGCVRLKEGNAKQLFELIVTQVGLKKARVTVLDLQDQAAMPALTPDFN